MRRISLARNTLKFFFLIVLVELNAQIDNLKFESFSTKEGLSSSTCLDVFQDSDGFLWFGTIDGLNKYNGYGFEIFRPIIGDDHSISNNRINKITEDAFGNLWVGTSNGLNFYDKDANRFHRVPIGINNKNSFSQRDEINELYYQKSKKRLWVGSREGLKIISMPYDHPDSLAIVALLDLVNGTEPHHRSLIEQEIEAIVEDGQGNIWIAAGKSVYRYREDGGKLAEISIRVPESYELDYLPKRLLANQNGEIWLANDLANIVVWSPETTQLKLISPVSLSRPIFDIYQDGSGKVWVATDGDGLYVLDSHGNLIQHIRHHIENPYSLPNDQLSVVMEDKDGSFWFGTYNKGVVKLAKSITDFGHYFYQPNDIKGLSSEIAQSVFQDSKGRIWVGTDGGGLNLFNGKNGHFTHYQYDPLNPYSISSDKILYLEESNDGDIWVCTWDGGLNKFNPDTERATRFKNDPSDSNSIGQNTVWCAVEDRKGRLWIGTQTEGLNCYDPKTEIFSKLKHHPEDTTSIISDFVFSLLIDSKQRLFVGTSLGLNVVDLAHQDTQTPSNIKFDKVKNESLQGNRINYIMEDHSGDIWLGTDLGLYKLSEELELLKKYSTADGLPNNLVLGIQEDDHHDLWVTTKSGMFRLSPEEEELKNFNINDGLQGGEFQSKSIAKTKDGKILAGGINGFNLFHPDDIKESKPQLNVLIEAFKVANQEVSVGSKLDGQVLLSEPIDKAEEVVLSYDQGHITIDFVALYYQNPDGINYAYKMEGLDKDFIITQNRVVNYSGLPSGSYTFKVKASLDRNWDRLESTNIRLYIKHPPWKTWWAYLLYISIVCCIVWTMIKYNTSIIRKEKERELDLMKLQFFMNVSHEFRTPLTLILNPTQKIITIAKEELVKSTAMTIQRSALKLLNLVNQLLEFGKLDLGKAPLVPVQDDIVRFVKEIGILFEDLIKMKSLTYSFVSDVEQLQMWFDPDKLEKVVSNVLSNAIKFTKQGEIELSIMASGSESVLISVRDTGVGLKKDHLDMVFERFFHVDATNSGTGIGLNFSKSLVDEHEGEIWAESEYGVGSTFFVRLPLISSSVNEALKQSSDRKSRKGSVDMTAVRSLEYDVSISENQPHGLEVNGGLQQAFDHVKRTLLIVEDNTELRHHLKVELAENYKIKEAKNGAIGLEKAIKFCPDLIISDIMMPEMDGFEMCQQIKTHPETSHIPIILLTARSLEEDKLEGYSLGADSYLSKPFNIHLLKARVSNLLSARQRLREKFKSHMALEVNDEMVTSSMDERFLDKVTKLIKDNIDTTDFGLDQILKEMGVSRSHFYRKIHSLTGQNPSNFIRTIKLKYAAELLKQGVYSIKEVAYRSGFNSSAYFSKTFKDLFHKTPQEYIEENSQ